MGYLVEEKDLESVKGRETSKRAILDFFRGILDRETVFFMSVSAMLEFCAAGRAVVPFFGTVDFSPQGRIQYLQRFNSFINDKSSDIVRALDGEQPKAAVFCLQGLNVIYMIDYNYKNEKIHCFETNLFHDILSRKIENSEMRILEFSPDLWQVYLDAVSKNLDGIGF